MEPSTAIDLASVHPTLKIGSSIIMSDSGGGVVPLILDVTVFWNNSRAFGREAIPVIGERTDCQEFAVSHDVGLAASEKKALVRSLLTPAKIVLSL